MESMSMLDATTPGATSSNKSASTSGNTRKASRFQLPKGGGSGSGGDSGVQTRQGGASSLKITLLDAAGCFSYSTAKSMKANRTYIGLVFRIMQVATLLYIFGWDLIKNKSYQSFDSISSSVTTKVKGIGLFPNGSYSPESNTFRIFDSPDYVIPAIEFNSLFIMTNFVETLQMQSTCLEDPTKKYLHCRNDSDCVQSNTKSAWTGMPTGKCVKKEKESANGTNEVIGLCEISAWCPVEVEDKDSRVNLIQNVENFTIFIKNDIQFKKFNKRRRNILTNITNDYISTCTRDPVTDPFCPILMVREILELAEPDPNERMQMVLKGGVIQIQISWNCDLDYDIEYCMPVYSFERFDLKFKSSSAASGFNFRYADKYQLDGALHRRLVKAYGLRIFIEVNGRAGRFDIIPLFLSVGSGIGLLAIPTLIADFLLFSFAKKRHLYRRIVEQDADEEYEQRQYQQAEVIIS